MCCAQNFLSPPENAAYENLDKSATKALKTPSRRRDQSERFNCAKLLPEVVADRGGKRKVLCMRATSSKMGDFSGPQLLTKWHYPREA